MAPNLLGNSLYIAETTIEQHPTDKSNNKPDPQILSSLNQNGTKTIEPYRVRLVWRNIIAFVYLHIAAVYGLYLCFTSAKASTVIASKLNCKQITNIFRFKCNSKKIEKNPFFF